MAERGRSLSLVFALVAAASVYYFVRARAVTGPWVFPDEFLYAEMARGLAEHGEPAVRGGAGVHVPFLYPLLLSPAFLVGHSDVSYGLIKAINAASMSLAAVPTYFLARRLVGRERAVIAAGLTLMVPSFAYTDLVMSENAFYPIFLASLLAIVRVLEHPTVLRQAVVFGALAVAFGARTEAIVLVATYVCSVFAVLALRGSLRQTAIRYVPSAALSAVLVLAALAIAVVSERPPLALAGIYQSALHGYSPVTIGKWGFYHLVDLDLYLGVLPFVALLVTAARFVRAPRVRVNGDRLAFTVVATMAVLATLVTAAAFSANTRVATGYVSLAPHLHERYVFYVAPLFLIVFVDSVWQSRRPGILVAAIVACMLPLLLPYARITANAGFESFAMVPWQTLKHPTGVMAAAAGVLCLPLLVHSRRRPEIQIGTVILAMWALGSIGHLEIQAAAADVPVSRGLARSWIEQRTDGERVAVLWAPSDVSSSRTLRRRQQALLRTEIFNPSLAQVFFVGTPMPYDLPQARVRSVAGIPPRYRYVLVVGDSDIRGRVIGRDVPGGLVLYCVSRCAEGR